MIAKSSLFARLARRRFIGTSTAALSAGTISRASAAQFQYKFAHNLPTEHPISVRMVEMFNEVKKETGGRFEATGFPNSVLGNEDALLLQTRSGAIQFFIINGALSGFVPLVNIIAIPFAFRSPERAYSSVDGELGDYIRKDMTSKGLFAFPKCWDNGFREITNSVRPVKTAEDLAGLKIRTPVAKLNQEFYRAMGASPAPVSINELYTALQTHLVDGQEGSYILTTTSHLYEVQRYLSVTNHVWAGMWFLANPAAMAALPEDIRASIMRNAAKYAVAERRDANLLSLSLAEKLRRLGMQINAVDAESFRSRLASQYKVWKNDFGPAVWDLLEKYSGKLA